MMTSVRALLSFAILGAIAATGCDSSEKSNASNANSSALASTTSQLKEPLTVEESVDITLTGTVKSVDLATRILTVQDSAGHELTFYVDPAVKRLPEVKPGDIVRLGGRAKLVAELRPPTPDESANPITVVSSTTRASPDQSAAANTKSTIRVVTTVVGVDVARKLVTLRGPLGDLEVVRGRSEENIKRLRVGDTIVITYTEAMAISLDKQ